MSSTTQTRTGLGLVIYCLGIARQTRKPGGGQDAADPLAFLEECHRLGAGGIQTPIGVAEPASLDQLRRTAGAYGMHIEAIVGPPRDAGDLERFEKEIVCARRAGATVARTVVIPGRRYEQFSTAAEFRQAEERALKSLQLAEPILARHRFRLAVENHKDQRVAEKLAMLKRLDSEWIGMCVDVANNFALMEDPLEAVRAFAPLAFTVHIKDQAVREYEDGFLLADAALGEGFLDLPAMVQTLRQARPEVKFNLEVITRDPLKLPVLTDKYWATLTDVPAHDLARAWRVVKTQAAPASLPTISNLSPDRQLERERHNIEGSLKYAKATLDL